MDGGDGPSADQLSLQALRHFRAGAASEGRTAYRRALGALGGSDLPVQRHAQLLAGTGLADAARFVLSAGLHAGADLSTGLVARKGDPHAAAAEYEELFARGVTNARMVSDYLVALSRAGASAKLAAVVDPDLLFRPAVLPGGDSVGPLLARVSEALLQAGSRRFQKANRSIRNMERVLKTHKIADPAIADLHEAVRVLIATYIADVTASAHIIAQWLRAEFDLHSWGVICEDAEVGFSAPHIHTGCWVVAVAYIAGHDPTAAGGAMRIGPAAAGDAACAGWPDITVAPTPGTVVIMPAFYTHWTEPLRRPGLRISVAFNADPPFIAP